MEAVEPVGGLGVPLVDPEQDKVRVTTCCIRGGLVKVPTRGDDDVASRGGVPVDGFGGTDVLAGLGAVDGGVAPDFVAP